MAEEEGGRPGLETSGFWRKEEPRVFEILVGFIRVWRDWAPRRFEVFRVVVIVVVVVDIGISFEKVGGRSCRCTTGEVGFADGCHSIGSSKMVENRTVKRGHSEGARAS